MPMRVDHERGHARGQFPGGYMPQGAPSGSAVGLSMDTSWPTQRCRERWLPWVHGGARWTDIADPLHCCTPCAAGQYRAGRGCASVQQATEQVPVVDGR